jgi:hypothetical protein
MKKLAALTATTVLLTGCTETITHPATAHECDSMRLRQGSAAYDDCISRLKSEEAPLGKAQGR